MILLRSLVFFFFMVLTIVFVAGPLSIIGILLPYRQRCRVANFWGGLNIKLLGAICGLDYEISGLERIPQGGAIILAKHQSAWETLALRYLLPPEQAWVAKRELLWVPIFGWAMALVQPIMIDRKSGRKAVRQVIETGTMRLQQGRLVVIFPEGTRVAPGEHKRYGIGGALLAEKSGFPIIPIAHNAGIFWRRRDIKKYPGTVQVVVGPTIEPEGLSAAEINRQVEEWIESTVAQLPQANGLEVK
ncbi:MAG: lysophospholipid acyltransferase family protein [Candidatus Sedimenticola sp. (ex Thyasira tokunagai)]